MAAANPGAAAAVVVPEALRGVKALTFDVFGTVVDWRSSVEAELAQRAAEKLALPASASLPAAAGARLAAMTSGDWAAFAQEWRESYYAFTRGFVPGSSSAWKDVDEHHLESLLALLDARGLADVFSEDEARELSRAWHRLRPWPDAVPGLRRLGAARFVTATLSNANRELLSDLDAYAGGGGLGFARILSAADFTAYKPHPRTYLGAAAALGLRPDEVAMVAAHLGDLAGARACGLRTIYVERPGEEAWDPAEERYVEARRWVDLWVAEQEGGFLEVARRLGIADETSRPGEVE
ncbi:haloacid dehalogenase [Durotheca rogersii]|uniref:haloacid dehalogenase n=1 Tax=Durotheca rogersii TaxID=419775 RepID=UPI00221F16AC|nr:haloacid dehalogenase [Durotheca rogersii]KAI5860260.1 haloacid dehalogenase [Durotheca rogersii]